MPEYVFKGRLLKVKRKQVRLPNGYAAALEVVEHPGAVLVVPFLDAGTIVMLRQYRAVIGRYLYELPAGTLDPRESPVACARRELFEETGYRAGSLKKEGVIFPVPGYSTERITVFSARVRACAQKKVPADIQPDEVIRHAPMTRARARSLFAAGRINDAKTICALAMCGWI